MVQSASHNPAQMARILPVVAYIHNHCDEDLPLERLAAFAELSPHYFHRLFRSVVGETTRRYVQRIRLERAAFQLLFQPVSILHIALDCGFQHHETFSRAFKKHFGLSPREYRRTRPAATQRILTPLRIDAPQDADFGLSSTRLQSLDALQVAYIRHTGPYDALPSDAWEPLLEWAQEEGIEPLTLAGIIQDIPGITPGEQLRFDAALLLPEAASPSGDIEFQQLPASEYAHTRHVGSYHSMLAAFYEILPRLQELEDAFVQGVPCLKIFGCTPLDVHHALDFTDIYIPVSRHLC